ncbi:MAG: 2-succinyl-6-hydroxy-2,4-cyclohexadiene-1-carboxylate synthase [Turneriella sp.]|nr:2-succinyl-6-hydroxy-2,4-cyclohexadiene-1-carboxylate synthase [Turneriella sp.]
MPTLAAFAEKQNNLFQSIDLDYFLNAAYTRFVPQSIRWNLGENLYNVYIATRRKATGARLGSAFLGDITVKYLEWGRPQLPKLIILHGFSDSKDGVLPYAHQLSRRYHVIAPDIPGFGESEKPARVVYTPDQFSSWLLRFIDKMHCDRFVLAGHSLGGAIAAELAIKIPNRIQKLIMISAAGLVPTHDGDNIYERILNGQNPFEVSSYEDFRNFFRLIFINPNMAPLPVKNYLFMKFSANRNWYHKIFLDLMGDVTDSDVIEKKKAEQVKKFASIRTPTLIVWGDRDGFFPESIGSWMHRIIKDSRYVVLPNAAHMPPLEQTGKLAQLSLSFLNT